MALALTALAVTGCEAVAQSGGARAQVERELEGMAGVADARVERTAFDTDYWGEEIVVDMEVDATEEEVTSVLDAFHARKKENDGAPQDARVTIGAGDTDTEGDDFAADTAPQAVPDERPTGNARIARVLVAAVAAFPEAAVIVTGGNWRVTNAVAGADPRPELDRIIDVVRSDDVLSSAAYPELVAVAASEDDRRTASVQANESLTPAVVSSWRELSRGVDLESLGSLSVGPTSIDLEVRAGERVTPRQLTTEAYGDVLWPTLHAALDTLVTMPRAATLTVTNLREAGGGQVRDRFLVTRPGLRTGRDRFDRTWNAEAATYLERTTR